MRWQNIQNLIHHEEIMKSIHESKEKGIPHDKLALAYARVSTKHNEQQNSKENQVEECKEYAEKQGLYIIYIFECAESAKAQGRKVFNTLIENALKYEIKHLILKDTSRLTRNLSDKDRINQLVKNDKMQVHFYLQNDILNSESRMLFSNIMSIIDADFSENLSIKMKHVARKKKEKGIPYQLPAGYIFGRSDRGETETSIIEFDPKYESIIHEMFDLYLNHGCTLTDISQYFNSVGYNTRQKKPFYESTIHRMLTNKFYTGKYFKSSGVWEKIGFYCPAYISEEQYEEIQRIIKVNSTGSKKRREKSYLLTGLVLCEKCKCFASGNRWSSTIYYSHKCKCNGSNKKPYWPEKTLIEAINLEVEKIVYNENQTEILKDRLRTIINSQNTITQKSEKEINVQINRLRKHKEVLLNDRLDETISKDDYKKRSNEIEKALKTCQERLENLTFNLSDHYRDAEKVIDAIRNFSIVYLQAVNIERIILLRNMAKWISFDGEKAYIEWKKPFNILLNTDETLKQHPAAYKETGDVILLQWVDDGIRTRNDWIHIPGLYR